MKTPNKIVSNYETEVDGIKYHVCIRRYDEDHYTADWSSATGDEQGELGYGLGQCSAIEREVERCIEKQHQKRGPK
jgi:hypothetical protein